MAGRSEVKAQIKLKFRNRVPQTLVAVRDFQLSQARTKMTYKALDAVVMTYRDNPTTVSRRNGVAMLTADTRSV
jgi:hypothetical protein